jgi:hypothetical protein
MPKLEHVYVYEEGMKWRFSVERDEQGEVLVVDDDD